MPQDFPFLRTTPRSAAQDFLGRFVRKTVNKGTIVTQRGEIANSLYIVFEGSLTGYIGSRNGREVVLDQISPGDMFGELSSLDGGSRVRTVRAESQCVLGELSSVEFNLWLSQNPQALKDISMHFATRRRELADRLYEFAIFDVEARVRLFLVRFLINSGNLVDGAVIDPAPTQSVIAGYVGANREAVSRAFSQMASAGILETNRRRIIIHDAQLLEVGS